MTPAASIPADSTLAGLFPVPQVSAPDATSPEVADLTRRLASGDEAAFRAFHAQYFDRLYHFLLVVTRGQEHAARDALQETLLRIVKHAREFEREDVFWSWLKAIARNAARDGGRKQRRYLALLEKFSFRPVDATPVRTPNEEHRLRELLGEVLAALDPLDRQLIEGKYLHGATVLELAAETSLTEKAVESRLLRLRRRLADTMLKQLRAP